MRAGDGDGAGSWVLSACLAHLEAALCPSFGLGLAQLLGTYGRQAADESSASLPVVEVVPPVGALHRGAGTRKHLGSLTLLTLGALSLFVTGESRGLWLWT